MLVFLMGLPNCNNNRGASFNMPFWISNVTLVI